MGGRDESTAVSILLEGRWETSTHIRKGEELRPRCEQASKRNGRIPDVGTADFFRNRFPKGGHWDSLDGGAMNGQRARK